MPLTSITLSKVLGDTATELNFALTSALPNNTPVVIPTTGFVKSVEEGDKVVLGWGALSYGSEDGTAMSQPNMPYTGQIHFIVVVPTTGTDPYGRVYDIANTLAGWLRRHLTFELTDDTPAIYQRYDIQSNPDPNGGYYNLLAEYSRPLIRKGAPGYFKAVATGQSGGPRGSGSVQIATVVAQAELITNTPFDPVHSLPAALTNLMAVHFEDNYEPTRFSRYDPATGLWTSGER